MVSTDNSFKTFVTGGEQERVRAGPGESHEVKEHSFLKLYLVTLVPKGECECNDFKNSHFQSISKVDV